MSERKSESYAQESLKDKTHQPLSTNIESNSSDKFKIHSSSGSSRNRNRRGGRIRNTFTLLSMQRNPEVPDITEDIELEIEKKVRKHAKKTRRPFTRVTSNKPEILAYASSGVKTIHNHQQTARNNDDASEGYIHNLLHGLQNSRTGLVQTRLRHGIRKTKKSLKNALNSGLSQYILRRTSAIKPRHGISNTDILQQPEQVTQDKHKTLTRKSNPYIKSSYLKNNRDKIPPLELKSRSDISIPVVNKSTTSTTSEALPIISDPKQQQQQQQQQRQNQQQQQQQQQNETTQSPLELNKDDDTQLLNFPPAIVLHGGLLSRSMSFCADKENEIKYTMRTAADIAYNILMEGGSAVYAVKRAVEILEDDPNFNAGTGAVLSNNGHPLLDATIADGFTQRTGSIGFASVVKNPISLACNVYEGGSIPIICGGTADQFAEVIGLGTIDPESLITKPRVDEYKQWRTQIDRYTELAESQSLDKTPLPMPYSIPKQAENNGSRNLDNDNELDDNSPAYRCASSHSISSIPPIQSNLLFGGVGAVAIDSQGRLAAASSSGGQLGRLSGQLSEAGVVGAGTWADSELAVCGTSTCDQLIVHQCAHTIAARKKFGKSALDISATRTLADLMISTGGDGGFIALDSAGVPTIVSSASHMPRAYCSQRTNHEPVVAVDRNEKAFDSEVFI